MNHKWFLLLAFAISFGSSKGVFADDYQLKFPMDRNCGTVLIGPQPESSGGFVHFHGPRNKVGIAQGLLIVPAGSFVELEINRAGARDLAFLNELPADGVHLLKITGAILGEAEFEFLSRFTALRAMQLTDCKTSSNLDRTKAAEARELQLLNFSMSDAESRRMLLDWAAKCRRLEYLYDREGAMDLESIRLFKDHSAINFLTVDFDHQAVDKIRALSEIPHLRALNVEVKSNDYLTALPQLKNVELFNWGGGRIDSEVLKTLGQLPNLKKIRFQGRAEIAADFAQGLKYLKTVEQLVLHARQIDCPQEELQIELVSMKSLTEIPRLKNPTRKLLDLLCDGRLLKSIDIDGLGSDATIDQIVRICQSKSLESVELHDIPFTTELGEALSNCRDLNFLSLEVAEFDGDLLLRPKSLENLTSLQISFSESAFHMESLARLPKLQQLTLHSNSLQQLDYQFIAECQLLTSLFIRGNVITDKAIEQIAQSQSLEILILGENCLLSDAGLKRLAQCHNLRNLSVGGIVSSVGILQLREIPGLNSLSVDSLLPDEDRRELTKQFGSLSSANFSTWRSSYGELYIRDDGFLRQRSFDNTEKADDLEGQSLKSVMGSAMSNELEQTLRGKVVLVDFWGVWCGPCLNLMPDLKRFRQTFGADRFEVLGVHTENQAEEMDEFLRKNPKPWPNLADTTGDLAKRFAVPYYPGLFLVDKQGNIRVAIPHRLGLEIAIQKLLDEK